MIILIGKSKKTTNIMISEDSDIKEHKNYKKNSKRNKKWYIQL